MTRLGKEHRLAEEVFMNVLIPIVSVLSLFVAAPVIVFSFILGLKKSDNETKKLQYQKEMLELEVKKEELQLRRLEAESKQYDRLINE
jgi:Na+-transporting NADH:ubiquinone oxidoreductase subunit NqrC